MVKSINSYYFSFSPTRSEEINEILRTVAAAGKSYHHTEDWEDGEPSCVDDIQDAANVAAEKLISVSNELERLQNILINWMKKREIFLKDYLSTDTKQDLEAIGHFVFLEAKRLYDLTGQS